jgi:very-short-patch-repair endonuclease
MLDPDPARHDRAPSPTLAPGLPTRRATNTARGLRRHLTTPERRLWKALRTVHLEGTHFRRQVPIGGYIADFACHGLRLVVEVDGPLHDTPDAAERDAIRDRRLQAAGYRVLRFSTKQIETDLDSVVARIAEACHLTD